MTSLQDIIKLIQAENGKAFIMDESGDVKLVIVGMEEYQRMQLGQLKAKIEDPEAVNRRILEAQLEEEAKQALPVLRPDFSNPKPQLTDLRSQVMDPDFNYGPVVDTVMDDSIVDDSEAIKPEFEDI